MQAPDWVNVVAVTPADHLVLVRQFRFGTETLSLEIPGGVMEPGEDPVAVDATIARLMGYNAADMEFLHLAARRGMGTCMVSANSSTVASVGTMIGTTT